MCLKLKKKNIDIFLDSGAYSVGKGKAAVTIDAYIDFVKQHEEHVEVYANLDVIGDPDATFENQKYMEEHGLAPMPVFHLGEPFEFLEYYKDYYDYLALGGMAEASRRFAWLDECWGRFLTDEEGYPLLKVHGFGMTEIKILLRYPWYSVDSSSWIKTAAYGSVWVPKYVNNEYDYSVLPHRILVSDRALAGETTGKHLYTLPQAVQKHIINYFALYKSDVAILMLDYKERQRLNVIYLKNLEDSLSEHRKFDKSLVCRKFFK